MLPPPARTSWAFVLDSVRQKHQAVSKLQASDDQSGSQKLSHKQLRKLLKRERKKSKRRNSAQGRAAVDSHPVPIEKHQEEEEAEESSEEVEEFSQQSVSEEERNRYEQSKQLWLEREKEIVEGRDAVRLRMKEIAIKRAQEIIVAKKKKKSLVDLQ